MNIWTIAASRSCSMFGNSAVGKSLFCRESAVHGWCSSIDDQTRVIECESSKYHAQRRCQPGRASSISSRPLDISLATNLGIFLL